MKLLSKVALYISPTGQDINKILMVQQFDLSLFVISKEIPSLQESQLSLVCYEKQNKNCLVSHSNECI